VAIGNSFPAKLHGDELRYPTSLQWALSWSHGTTTCAAADGSAVCWMKAFGGVAVVVCVAAHWLSSCCLSLSRLCGEGTSGHRRWFVSHATFITPAGITCADFFFPVLKKLW